MSQTVAVIGSGLSAVGAIKALRAHGILPTVIDRGENLDPDRAQWVAAIAQKTPEEWSAAERYELSSNPTLNDGSSIPKKLLFGSDYFYGRSSRDAPVHAIGNCPPFSYALGGLSAGWGAAVLPPQGCDLADWPVSVEELNEYCTRVLEDLPYSAKDDGLSLDFPMLSRYGHPLRPGRTDQWLLTALSETTLLKKGETVYGQARLLVAAGDGEHCCRYCGQCMSGCVYGAIYKAGDEIRTLHKKGEIEYLADHLVERLEEQDGQVEVFSRDASGVMHRRKFDRVFVATGAVNSARLVLQSLDLYKRKVRMSSRGGFVIPMLSLRRLPVEWPKCNTQPGLFLEFRNKWLEHWVHVQISAESELLLQKLAVAEPGGGILARLKRFIADRIVLLFVNYHSDHSGGYDLWLEPAADSSVGSCLHSVHHRSYPQWRVWLASWMRLFSIFGRIGCMPLLPVAKLNSGAYHVGGTLPMKEQPANELETDTLGRVAAWKQVHFVDTATFPSLPGTTIGLLAMANAYRIVDRLKWVEKKRTEDD